MKPPCAMLGCVRSCNVNATLCDVHYARVLERAHTPLATKSGGKAAA